MLIIMEEQNEILNEKVSAENELKDIIINYVGEQMNPENNCLYKP